MRFSDELLKKMNKKIVEQNGPDQFPLTVDLLIYMAKRIKNNPPKAATRNRLARALKLSLELGKLMENMHNVGDYPDWINSYRGPEKPSLLNSIADITLTHNALLSLTRDDLINLKGYPYFVGTILANGYQAWFGEKPPYTHDPVNDTYSGDFLIFVRFILDKADVKLEDGTVIKYLINSKRPKKSKT